MSLKELEKRLEQEPENLGLRVMLAGAMREAGRHDEARELYFSVALAYRDQGRFQQAIAVCKHVLEMAPADKRASALMETLTGLRRPPPPPTGPFEPVPPPREAIKIPLSDIPVAPARRSSMEPTPVRRSSVTSDQTPLPQPLPYHIADPTSASQKISLSELPTMEGADTRPGAEPPVDRPSVEGLKRASRRISQTLSGALSSTVTNPGTVTTEMDMSAELDTRQRPKLDTDQVERLSEPPPTVPVELISGTEDDTTPVPLRPRDSSEELTNPHSLPLEKIAPIHSAFFQPLPRDKRKMVLSRFYKRNLKKSQTMIRQGERNHPLVLVVTGRLEVRTERADGSIGLLETIEEGDFVGEAALLARTPSEANVVATADSELLLLAPSDFYEIAGAFPALWSYLKIIADRRRGR